MKKWVGLSILLIQGVVMAGSADTGGKTFEKATFAGGCFWCMEPPFENLKERGVVSVMPGYTGGHAVDPTYEQVSEGDTGHAEAVEVVFDPSKIGYEELLEVFWRNIDPTTENSQFADHGTQYRTAIFTHGEAQKKAAEASKAALAKSGKFKSPIVTEVTAASMFYPAEEYHREYHKKNPLRYKSYSVGSGRKGYLERTWGAGGKH